MNEIAGKEIELEETKTLLIQALTANRIQPENIELFKNILMRLCAVYLMRAKRNGLALNPVGQIINCEQSSTHYYSQFPRSKWCGSVSIELGSGFECTRNGSKLRNYGQLQVSKDNCYIFSVRYIKYHFFWLFFRISPKWGDVLAKAKAK